MSEQARCDGCGQTDDHPKHVVLVGVAEAFGQPAYHPRDTDHDGFLSFHYDCDEQNPFVAELDPEIVAAAKSEVHGEDLRGLILSRAQEG